LKIENKQKVEEKLPLGQNNKWMVWRTLTYRRWTFEGKPEKMRNKTWEGRSVCGEVQKMSHLLNCNKCSIKCDILDLQVANNKGIKMAEFWSDKI
jgi:hypothetical protein